MDKYEPAVVKIFTPEEYREKKLQSQLKDSIELHDYTLPRIEEQLNASVPKVPDTYPTIEMLRAAQVKAASPEFTEGDVIAAYRQGFQAGLDFGRGLRKK